MEQNNMQDNGNSLVESSNHQLTTQVRTANIQLSIASELTLNLEKNRFIEILKRIDKQEAVTFFSINTFLNEAIIQRFGDEWDWFNLSESEALPWSIGLLKLFETLWVWGDGSAKDPYQFDRKIQGNFESMPDLGDGWYQDTDWGPRGISGNESLPWSIELIERFESLWDWGESSDYQSATSGLSGNESLPFSIELIERFEVKWSWSRLSDNKALPYSIDLLERFEDQWDWERLSKNSALPFSIDLLERFEDKWNWAEVSDNVFLPWSIALIERFEDKWGWISLSSNEAVPWSMELIKRFTYESSVQYTYADSPAQFIKGFRRTSAVLPFAESKHFNESLPHLIDEIELHEEFEFEIFQRSNKFDEFDEFEGFEPVRERYWSKLSRNEALPWSIELIERFMHRWDWPQLSQNESLPWSIELIERFENKFTVIGEWTWSKFNERFGGELTRNSTMPWSIELIERFKDKWWWEPLSQNESLPWSIEFIKRFEDKWNWEVLSSNKVFLACIPKLSIQDIDEVMTHHFPEGMLR